MQTKLQGNWITPADWFWEQVKRLQRQGEVDTQLRRVEPGGAEKPGWRTEKRGEDVWAQVTKLVGAACRRHGEARHGGTLVRSEHFRPIYQAAKRAAGVAMTRDMMRAALWEVAATTRVTVEGQTTDATLGGDWKSERWWEQLELTAKERGVTLRRTAERVLAWAEGTVGEGRPRRRWLHLCSGEGKGFHGAAVGMGFEVVAVDVKEASKWARRKGVRRLQMNLAEMSWELWRLEAGRQAGVKEEEWLGGIMGLPCTTFNHADPANEREGSQGNYRDHGSEEREPQHAEGTAKGDLAREHDWLAEGAVRTLAGNDWHWLVENPEAYLRMRPYMARVAGQLRTVEYCNFWSAEEAKLGAYKKSTNLWTGTRWRSQGQSGTGRCEQKCKWGWKGPQQRWQHEPMQGRRQGVKERMPEALAREWLEATQRQIHV